MPARNGLHYGGSHGGLRRGRIHPMSDWAAVEDDEVIRPARRPGEWAGGTTRLLTSAFLREPPLRTPGVEVRTRCRAAVQ